MAFRSPDGTLRRAFPPGQVSRFTRELFGPAPGAPLDSLPPALPASPAPSPARPLRTALPGQRRRRPPGPPRASSSTPARRRSATGSPTSDHRPGNRGPSELRCRATTERLQGAGRRWDADNAEALRAREALDPSAEGDRNGASASGQEPDPARMCCRALPAGERTGGWFFTWRAVILSTVGFPGRRGAEKFHSGIEE